GGSTPERRLDIMRDPRVGSFGVVAVALVLLGDVAALAGLGPRGALAALLAAAALGRLAVVVVIVLLPYARAGGLGTAAAGGRRLPDLAAAAQRLGGAGAVAAVAAGAAAAACAAERAARRTGPAGWVGLAIALKPAFALRQLLEEALAVAACLEEGRLDDARWTLRALVSRPAADLLPELVASAAIESLAENLADSVAASLLAFALLGLPAAAVYRVVNTADAMVGYHGELERLGHAAARAGGALS